MKTSSISSSNHSIKGQLSKDGQYLSFDVKVGQIIEQTLLRSIKSSDFKKCVIQVEEPRQSAPSAPPQSSSDVKVPIKLQMKRKFADDSSPKSTFTPSPLPFRQHSLISSSLKPYTLSNPDLSLSSSGIQDLKADKRPASNPIASYNSHRSDSPDSPIDLSTTDPMKRYFGTGSTFLRRKLSGKELSEKDQQLHQRAVAHASLTPMQKKKLLQKDRHYSTGRRYTTGSKLIGTNLKPLNLPVARLAANSSDPYQYMDQQLANMLSEIKDNSMITSKPTLIVDQLTKFSLY